MRTLVRYLGISDGNMEEGSLRCDANVSLRPRGATELGTKTELKNMNSFKNVRDAIEHEVKRQAALLDRGERVVQETRLWDAARGVTQAMRSKEQAHDYRYFPEPDLPPLVVDDAELAGAARQPARAARGSLRPLHRRRSGSRRRTRACWSPSARSPPTSTPWSPPGRRPSAPPTGSSTRCWPASTIPRASARPTCPCRRPRWPSWSSWSRTGTLSGKLGKDVFAKMWAERRTAGDIVAAEGLAQVSDGGALEEACKKVDRRPPRRGGALQGGNPKLMGFFVGRGHEGDRRQGKPQGRQRDPAAPARVIGGPGAAMSIGTSGLLTLTS